MRRRLMTLAMLCAICLSTAGPFFSTPPMLRESVRVTRAINSSDPNERMREMLNENESRGPISANRQKSEQPSHLTPVRIHGRVGP